MRWKKIKLIPQLGDTKDVERFAWCPIDMGDHMVWLERYVVRLEYCEYEVTERVAMDAHYDCDHQVTKIGWKALKYYSQADWKF